MQDPKKFVWQAFDFDWVAPLILSSLEWSALSRLDREDSMAHSVDQQELYRFVSLQAIYLAGHDSCCNQLEQSNCKHINM